MLSVTNETKAVLQAEKGRIVGFIKSSEPGKISIAVPGERAVMTPAQARQLAAWLVEEANTGATATREGRAESGWRTAEARRQTEIRSALHPSRRAF
ncbi:hypothetical protein [Streptomyces sp. NPDC048643]|uniref:hypothetical protein n=1 Tax=Streptomyces sp. NPDC048643 TaxID=3155637 RepID=UPI00342DF67D